MLTLSLSADDLGEVIDHGRDGDHSAEADVVDGDARIRISNNNAENGYDIDCRHCGETIEDQGAGWIHSVTEESRCDASDPDNAESNRAEPSPFYWLNSATITADEDEDAVRLSFSIGDPRGAWVMTVRRIPDDAETNAGALLVHVPYPAEPFPHTGLRELHPGTYLVTP